MIRTTLLMISVLIAALPVPTQALESDRQAVKLRQQALAISRATLKSAPAGFINFANGNLHLEIPITSSPLRGRRGRSAMETVQSALDSADIRLGPYSQGVPRYELTPDGISISMSETDFRMLAAFSPALTEVIPLILSEGRFLIELARIATIVLLADILDSLSTMCYHNGGNIAQDEPRKKTCVYECDDGSPFFLVDVPVEEQCPSPLLRMRTFFIR